MRYAHTMNDPYKVLGVPRSADDESIRKAYKSLAKRYHPDVAKSAGAEDKFKQISAAYTVLSDPEQRRRYDEFGEVGLKPGFDPRAARGWRHASGGSSAGYGQGFAGFDDVLESLFGTGGGRRQARGTDQYASVTIDPMMTFTGGEYEVNVRRSASGGETLRIRVPAGAKDGGKLRLKGQGLPPRGGGPCGDLVLRLTVPSHPKLRRREDHLELDVPITVLEALQGGTITVPTPTGSVKVAVPAGATAGSKLRVRGRGVQKRGRPGDLFLVLRVVAPSTGAPEALEAAEILEGFYGTDVRADLEL